MKATSVAFVVLGLMDKVFHFYILYSQILDKYYVGHTGGDLSERVRKHNSNHRGFTGRGHDWIVCYTEQFPNKTLAYARERQVKRWKSRVRIRELCNLPG
jgi:putative endonuclease